MSSVQIRMLNLHGILALPLSEEANNYYILKYIQLTRVRYFHSEIKVKEAKLSSRRCILNLFLLR